MISYRNISDAIDFYTTHGYEYIEVPWAVGLDAIIETAPANATILKLPFGNLVGSGEQSLLDIRETLKKDHRYVCATPCFRHEMLYGEPVVDKYHLPYFFKVELMHTTPNNRFEEHNVLADALRFFRMYTDNAYVVDTPIGKDIYINGIEVGSYGYRKMPGFDWIYGTGCAEPRLSQALQKV